MKFLKVLLIALALIPSFPILAMEAPEQMDTTPDDVVILVSAEGKEFELPRSIAMRAGQIAGLFEAQESGQELGIETMEQNRFPFSSIDTNTLAILVQLLTKLDQLLQQNDNADALNQIYIPRTYQPYVNQLLENLNPQEIAELYNAADFLEVPFILNAVAAVIADRIHEQIIGDWENLKLAQQKELVSNALTSWNIFNKQEYIFRQITFRKNGIKQETSIADFITITKRQPNINSEGSITELKQKRFTSLFGLHLINEKTKVFHVDLGKNCFFDLSLDPQPGTFNGFHALKILDLKECHITNLQPGIFDELHALNRLELQRNQLTSLHPGIFDELYSLDSLALFSNQLTNLPPQIFDKLTALTTLHLALNQLSYLPPQIFNKLHALKILFIGYNKLSTQNERELREALPGVFIKTN